jgi:phospho-N-acetylmuramoyl-pentapeptide-transferase
MLIATLLHYYGFSIFAAAVAGGCAGFLVYNFHPARVFMGDTGSLFLGGMIVAMGFGIGYPILILPIGIIYFAETLSVIIQVSYFKLTRRLTGQGKRIFKMSPIHHHFEMCGWNEVKIVTVFSLVTVIGGALAVLSVLLG